MALLVLAAVPAVALPVAEGQPVGAASPADPRAPDSIPTELRYALAIDRYLTSTAAADTLLSIHRVLYTAEDGLLPPVLWPEDRFGSVAGGVTYRLARSVLLDNVLDHIVFLAQHEVFGHGARYRELGYVDNSFHLSLFFPYGDAHGYASTGVSTQPTSGIDRVLRIAGGNEATTVLARNLRSRWSARGSLHYHELFLYVASTCNLPLYVIGTQLGVLAGPANDINQYLAALGSIEVDVDLSSLSLKRLSRYALLSFADPFLYSSIVAYVGYLGSGRAEWGVPMLPTGSVRYAPSFHLMLAPFGPEFVMENYLRLPGRSLEVSVRFTDPSVCSAFGAACCVSPAARFTIATVPITIDAAGAIWYQPVLPDPTDLPILLVADDATEGAGGMAAVSARVGLLPASGLYVELMAKSDGYVEGEPLYGCVLLRGGLALRL